MFAEISSITEHHTTVGDAIEDGLLERGGKRDCLVFYYRMHGGPIVHTSVGGVADFTEVRDAIADTDEDLVVLQIQHGLRDRGWQLLRGEHGWIAVNPGIDYRSEEFYTEVEATWHCLSEELSRFLWDSIYADEA